MMSPAVSGPVAPDTSFRASKGALNDPSPPAAAALSTYHTRWPRWIVTVPVLARLSPSVTVYIKVSSRF
jgi:hypothetical protein